MSLPKRKSPRRSDYDYSSSGTYQNCQILAENENFRFVTICTKHRQHYFGEIVGTGFALSDALPYVFMTEMGKICDQEINHMVSLRHNLDMREYVIMPNHIHLLFSFGSITAVEASHDPTKVYVDQTLSSIIWSFKSAVTRECNNYWLNICEIYLLDKDHFMIVSFAINKNLIKFNITSKPILATDNLIHLITSYSFSFILVLYHEHPLNRPMIQTTRSCIYQTMNYFTMMSIAQRRWSVLCDRRSSSQTPNQSGRHRLSQR